MMAAVAKSLRAGTWTRSVISSFAAEEAAGGLGRG